MVALHVRLRAETTGKNGCNLFSYKNTKCRLKFFIICMKYCTIVDNVTAPCIGGIPVYALLGTLQLRFIRPDFLFAESAWQGWHNSWKYKIAAYPDHPERNNHALLRLLEYAQKKHIPSVFWDKEGLVHFDRFIGSAKHFDHVFTVDADTIPKYKAVMGEKASVHILPFAVHPKLHFFDGFHFKYTTACFVGSYSSHIHPQRRVMQEMLFHAALDSGLGLHIFDRNSKRKANVYRYPEWCGTNIHASVPNAQTAAIYKDYLVSLNVNTNANSPTMVSRRLVEVLACGGIAVTTPAPSVEKEFRDFCHIVHSSEETTELFARLKYGPSKEDLERARAGADYIAQHRTWEHNLRFVRDIIGLK